MLIVKHVEVVEASDKRTRIFNVAIYRTLIILIVIGISEWYYKKRDHTIEKAKMWQRILATIVAVLFIVKDIDVIAASYKRTNIFNFAINWIVIIIIALGMYRW
jgi:uncharacterized membrane protein